jgi:UDP-glucose 4-epimerase
MARRILVTGGAGFIGSHLVDALVAAGDEVTVVDNLSTGRIDNVAGALDAGARLVEVDVADADAVRAVIHAARPQVVFHLAARVDVRQSVADPVGDASANLVGTVAVLQAAQEAGARRFVYSSTGGALYGNADTVPTDEDAPVRPLSPYGMSKAAGEQYAQWFAEFHGLPVVSLRYANVYGPRQDASGEGGVVAVFCARALTGRAPVVHGDGRQTRDFVHVADVVRANLAAAAGDVTGAYNIGSGVETSVLELVGVVEEAARMRAGQFTPVNAPARGGEVMHSALDASRASRDLGFTASVGLVEGVRETLASLAGNRRPRLRVAG